MTGRKLRRQIGRSSIRKRRNSTFNSRFNWGCDPAAPSAAVISEHVSLVCDGNSEWLLHCCDTPTLSHTHKCCFYHQIITKLNLIALAVFLLRVDGAVAMRTHIITSSAHSCLYTYQYGANKHDNYSSEGGAEILTIPQTLECEARLWRARLTEVVLITDEGRSFTPGGRETAAAESESRLHCHREHQVQLNGRRFHINPDVWNTREKKTNLLKWNGSLSYQTNEHFLLILNKCILKIWLKPNQIDTNS